MARSSAWWWPPPRSAAAVAADRLLPAGRCPAGWLHSRICCLHSVSKGACGQLGQAALDLALQGIQSMLSCLEATQCFEQPASKFSAVLQRLAERAAWLVEVEYLEDTSLGTPILSIADAIKAESFYGAHPEPVRSGNAVKALAEAKNVIKGAR